MRLKLYNDLKDYLLKLEDSGNRIFAHAELWNEQIKFIEEEVPFPLPAIFIEFKPIQWTQRNNSQQSCSANLVFHIVTNDALTALLLSEPLHYHLARFSSPYTSRPIRVSSSSDHNHLELIDDQNGYIIQGVDESASKPAVSTLLTAKISK